MKIFGLSNSSNLIYANHEVITLHEVDNIIMSSSFTHEENELYRLKITFLRTKSCTLQSTVGQSHKCQQNTLFLVFCEINGNHNKISILCLEKRIIETWGLNAMFFTWSFSCSSHGQFSSLEVFSVSSRREFSHSIYRGEEWDTIRLFYQMTCKKSAKESNKETSFFDPQARILPPNKTWILENPGQLKFCYKSRSQNLVNLWL